MPSGDNHFRALRKLKREMIAFVRKFNAAVHSIRKKHDLFQWSGWRSSR
jgi:hypothetical protein